MNAFYNDAIILLCYESGDTYTPRLKKYYVVKLVSPTLFVFPEEVEEASGTEETTVEGYTSVEGYTEPTTTIGRIR